MRKNILATLAVSISLAILVIPKPAVACSQNPLLGSICMVGFNFCPRGFSRADGQLLAISSNNALFSLFGTFYGGDGRTTFALPDLRGRVPIHEGSGPGLSPYSIGQKNGVETVTLTEGQMPSHSHTATLHAATAGGNTEIPTDNILANSRRSSIYKTGGAATDLNSRSITVSNTGSSQSHENRQPSLAIRYCVATVGIYPSRN